MLVHLKWLFVCSYMSEKATEANDRTTSLIDVVCCCILQAAEDSTCDNFIYATATHDTTFSLFCFFFVLEIHAHTPTNGGGCSCTVRKVHYTVLYVIVISITHIHTHFCVRLQVSIRFSEEHFVLGGLV